MSDNIPTVTAYQRPWSLTEDQQLRNLCLTCTTPVHAMVSVLGRSKSSIRRRIKQLGIEYTLNKCTYSKDNSFFTVPNHLNSYFAGWIAADGTVDWEDYAVRVTLQEDDVELLENWKSATQYTGKIGFKLSRGLGVELSRQHFVDVYSARQWCEDLHRNFGVIPQKAARLAPPNTTNDLLNLCFILGYTDGDGSVCFTDGGAWDISWTSASPLVLEYIRAFCDRMLEPVCGTKRANVRHYEQHYVYTIKGYRAIQLFDILCSLPVPKLRRKWENPEILRVIAARKSRRPDLFPTDYQPVSFDSAGNLIRHAEVVPFTAPTSADPAIAA